MLFAASYPLLDIVWTMIVFFAWVIWFWMLILVLTDVFRRRDLSGWAKAGWVIFTVILPFLGVLVYLVFHGHEMAERRAREAADTQAMIDDHIRTVAASGSGSGNGGATAEIADAKRLLDSGAISQAEFDELKRKALTAA